MRMGVVSDSHGETANLHSAVHDLVQRYGADLVIHLGDDYADAAGLEAHGVPVIRVPGVWDEEYRDGLLPHRRLEVFEGWRFLLSHTPGAHEKDGPDDCDPAQVMARGEADVLLHGHTHTPRVEIEDGAAFINPGHLKSHDRKGVGPSYAVLDVTPDVIEVRIVALGSAQPLLEQRIERRR